MVPALRSSRAAEGWRVWLRAPPDLARRHHPRMAAPPRSSNSHLKAAMMDDPDEIKTAHIDPHEEGWKRHPVIARTWVQPDGRLYTFAPDVTEKLVVQRK